MATVPSPLEWFLQWLPTVGWAAVIGIIWKASRFLTKLHVRATETERNIRTVADSHAELKETLFGQVVAQKELVAGVHQLSDAVFRQAEAHAEQLDLIRTIIGEQKVLAANQAAIMNGFQRVIEQLIEAVSDGTEDQRRKR